MSTAFGNRYFDNLRRINPKHYLIGSQEWWPCYGQQDWILTGNMSSLLVQAGMTPISQVRSTWFLPIHCQTCGNWRHASLIADHYRQQDWILTGNMSSPLVQAGMTPISQVRRTWFLPIHCQTCGNWRHTYMIADQTQGDGSRARVGGGWGGGEWGGGGMQVVKNTLYNKVHVTLLSTSYPTHYHSQMCKAD